MLEISKSTNNIGATFSSVNPNIYNQFKKDQDGEVFEKVVFDLMLNKYSDDADLSDYILSLPNDKQRMALLSLIDGDTALWSKMNSYVNDCSDKFEHIKDVIKIMSKFVKDGEVERKKFGEVMTPLELVKEMLNTLPKEVWSNPNLKWLDPANGAGTFPYVVIYKLMNGLKDVEGFEDTEVRYKHIVENMIYTCELQSRNVFLWLCGVDPKDEYTTNSYWGSFLDEGFDYHMKNVWDVDKFDIIIGNPPYQWRREEETRTHSLWDLFVNKSFSILNVDGYLSMVHPGSWRNYSGKFENIKSMFLGKDILYLNINDYDKGNEIFGVSTDFDFYLVRNSFNDISTKIIDAENVECDMKLSKVDFIPNKNIKILLDVTSGTDKVDTIIDSSYHTQRDFLSRERSEEFRYPIIYTVKANGEPVLWYSKINNRGHFGKPKVVFSNGAGSGVFVDETGEYGLSQFAYGIVESDVDKLTSIKNIMINNKFINLLGYGSGSKYNKNIIRIFDKKSWDKLKIILSN